MRYIFLILGRACGFDTTFTGEKLFSQSVSVRMLSLKWVFQVVRFLGGEEKNRFGHGNQADVDFQAAVLVETAHQKKARTRRNRIPRKLG